MSTLHVRLLARKSVLLALLILAACATDGSSGQPDGLKSNDDGELEPDAPAPDSTDPQSRLWLERVGGDAELALELRYTRGHERSAPRVAEIVLKHPGLALQSSEAGAAATAAAKDLIVQDRGEGTTRLVLLASTNVSALESGTLAVLRFERTGAEAPRIEILVERPVFAPMEANEGLLIADPMSL